MMTLLIGRARDLGVRSRGSVARFSFLATARASVSSISELFPEPETPVTQVNVPSGIRKSTSRKLCCRAPKISIQPPPGGSLAPPASMPRFGDRDLLAARKKLSGERGRGPREFLRRSCRGNRSAEPPGPRTEVEEPVSRFEDFAVVFDENDRVSQIAQSPERSKSRPLSRGCRPIVGSSRTYKTPVSAADLSGQPDPLGLAAGKRRHRARQRQIVQSHVDQKRDGWSLRSAGRPRFFVRSREFHSPQEIQPFAQRQCEI